MDREMRETDITLAIELMENYIELAFFRSGLSDYYTKMVEYIREVSDREFVSGCENLNTFFAIVKAITMHISNNTNEKLNNIKVLKIIISFINKSSNSKTINNLKEVVDQVLNRNHEGVIFIDFLSIFYEKFGFDKMNISDMDFWSLPEVRESINNNFWLFTDCLQASSSLSLEEALKIFGSLIINCDENESYGYYGAYTNRCYRLFCLSKHKISDIHHRKVIRRPEFIYDYDKDENRRILSKTDHSFKK